MDSRSAVDPGESHLHPQQEFPAGSRRVAPNLQYGFNYTNWGPTLGVGALSLPPGTSSIAPRSFVAR